MEEYKELPHDLEVEQAFLGSCLMVNNNMESVIDFLLPEHFASVLHQDIYKVFVEYFNKGKRFDPIVLKPHFFDHDQLPDDMSSGLYLSKLVSLTLPPKMANNYARAIYDYYIRRTVISTSATSQASAFDDFEKAGVDIIEEIQTALSALTIVSDEGKELVHISHGADKALEIVTEAMNGDRPLAGITFGIPSLDAATGGMRSGNLIVLAGRPGMGKSALALSIAKGAALQGHTGAFFSIEMEADELTLRVASDFTTESNTPVTYFDAGNGKLTDGEYDSLRLGFDKVRNLPIHISDRGGNTVDSVRIETRRLMRKIGKKVDFIVIDYLQLMTMGYGFKGNRTIEISQMTMALKRLAKEMQVRIILLSQLNRGLEARENKRPMLADLRESGSIEQDADMVLFVYRDYYYLKQNEPKAVADQADWLEELNRKEKILEIIIGKQRRGPTKTLRVECALETNSINDFKD